MNTDLDIDILPDPVAGEVDKLKVDDDFPRRHSFGHSTHHRDGIRQDRPKQSPSVCWRIYAKSMSEGNVWTKTEFRVKHQNDEN